MLQLVGKKHLNRSEHVWQRRLRDYKCVLCGAVTTEMPPDPIPANWLPERWEQLTDGERALCPSPTSSVPMATIVEG